MVVVGGLRTREVSSSWGVQLGVMGSPEETRGMGSDDFELNGAGNELRWVFLGAVLRRMAVFRRRATATSGF